MLQITAHGKVVMNNKGLSFTETLISILLTSFVASAVMLWTKAQSSTLNGLSQRKHIDHLVEDIASAFADNDSFCTNVLAGTVLNTQIPALNYFNLDNTKLRSIIEVGKDVDGTALKVEDIRLVPQVVIDAKSMIADFRITFSQKNVLGPSHTTHGFPINAYVQNNKVVSCTVAGIGSLEINQRICELRNDGYAHYDPITKGCVNNPGVQWISGINPNSATCPTGFKIAASRFNTTAAYLACTTAAPIAAGLAPRTYTNGAVDSTPLYAAINQIDFDTETCNFYYGVGLTPPPGFIAKIKCAPE